MRLDVEALARGLVLPGEVCEIAGVGPIPLAAAVALVPHAAIDVVLRDGCRVRNVTSAGTRLRRQLHPGPAGPPPPHRTRIVLRLDVGALRGGRGGRVEVAGVGGLDRDLLRRLLPERAIELISAAGVDPRTIQIEGRRYPRPLEVAFREEQPVCADCGGSMWIEHDHEVPVALDGLTTLDNLTARCPRCHRHKTRAEAPRTVRAGVRRGRTRRRPQEAAPA